MHLVDAHGRRVAVPLPAFPHPLAVVPSIFSEAIDDGSGAGRSLAAEGEGVRLEGHQFPFVALDLEFVKLAGHQMGNEEFPDAVHGVLLHGMAAAVPVIERTDHTDSVRIGRPHGEGHAGYAIEGARVGTQPFVGLQVSAFAQQIAIQFAQHGSEAIRILGFPGPTVPVHSVAVFEGSRRRRHEDFEQAFGMHLVQLRGHVTGFVAQQFDALRPGHESADQDAALGQGVHAEPVHGAGEVTAEEGVEVEISRIDGHQASVALSCFILPSSRSQTRNASVTLQAWASQPRWTCGSSPSRISGRWPTQPSLRIRSAEPR